MSVFSFSSQRKCFLLMAWACVPPVVACWGCGNSPRGDFLSAFAVDDCSGGSAGKSAAADVVYLEWGGGETRIYPGDVLPGLDLSAFWVLDGETLAEQAEEFKAAVRIEVSRILCDMPTEGVYLANSKAGLPRDVTTVYFAQMGSPAGGPQIGQGEYDPCNEAHDNHAIIFGEEILALGEERSFSEWVRVFSNVTAHEIGHTLGYGHVPRVVYAPAQRPSFVELMMASHTVDEMLQPQRLLADTSNCPENGSAKTAVAAVMHCHTGDE